jgi:hypothetical protein
MVCWKRSTFPQVVGRFGREFFCWTPRRARACSRAFVPPRPPARRVVKTRPLSVRVEAGMPWSSQAARKVSRVAGPVTVLWAVMERA